MAVHEVFAGQFEDSRIVSKGSRKVMKVPTVIGYTQPTTQRIDSCTAAVKQRFYKTIVKGLRSGTNAF